METKRGDRDMRCSVDQQSQFMSSTSPNSEPEIRLYPRIRVKPAEDGDPSPLQGEALLNLVTEVESSTKDCRMHVKLPSHCVKCCRRSPKPVIKRKLASKGSPTQGKPDSELLPVTTTSSSGWRPRAVLSSPENDELVGCQNELIKQQDEKRKQMTPQARIADKATAKKGRI